jgi:hypothetical protein
MDHLYFEKGECCRALKSLPFAENKFASGGGSTVVATLGTEMFALDGLFMK